MPDIGVLDSFVHHEESGTGAPVVFLHGNPGSSHLWRKVFPGLSAARLLAPDLIGMGRSGKPDIPYLFTDHARYLDAWFDAAALDRVVLVGHDWGGALAFDWAARHPDRVRGVVFFESIIKPMTRDELPAPARERVERFRTPGLGEQLVLDENLFVRQAFTGGVLTPLSEEDLLPYLAPYPTRESRRPILAWARQMPFDGEPADLVRRIEAYDRWLTDSARVPKLLLTFEGSPTLLVRRELAAWCAANIACLETEACGQSGHHAPEDRPEEIAGAISRWLDRHGLR
ncbi:haloalkane dehalogenase [Pseudonocardia spinosispora]|uniref:haloalkane dehalogenase n=1 Tax=Pseudonocardia spinosispora TaxID=103441 RepID=UPI00042875AD|nr:haloalkane dehalogenase [Pseudonocardia spinosispora]